MRRVTLLLISWIFINWSFGQEPTVEAEFDTAFNFQFQAIKKQHHKNILIDKAHNTIYSLSYGAETAREMLRIMEVDGFELNFNDQILDSNTLNNSTSDLLILHGMPNDKIVLGSGEKKEILYKSPLKDEEVENIGRFVYHGGSLFVFLSHFPGGRGALPLLESFSIKFRDGYAYHPRSPGHNGGICSLFEITTENGMINSKHPVLSSRLSEDLLPDSVKFLCGAAVFRNPEDNILAFPPNSTNYTKTTDGSTSIEEYSDSYAGMIGFEFGEGRVIVCTDQGIFRSLDLLLDGERVHVTIHDPDCDNAELFVNCLRWLGQLQGDPAIQNKK